MGDFFAVIACIIWAATVAYLVGVSSERNEWQSDLISRGFAIYCPDDGAFAFKGECNED